MTGVQRPEGTRRNSSYHPLQQLTSRVSARRVIVGRGVRKGGGREEGGDGRRREDKESREREDNKGKGNDEEGKEGGRDNG